MKTFYIILGLSLMLFSGCTTGTYDDLEETQVIIPIEKVTFQDVSFVFENICTACHSDPPQNGAPMPLTSYSAVRNAVETRGLLDRISRNDGENGLMPFGGPRLPQQDIDLIVKWNEDGLLEN
jgi:hypothetical protein